MDNERVSQQTSSRAANQQQTSWYPLEQQSGRDGGREAHCLLDHRMHDRTRPKGEIADTHCVGLYQKQRDILSIETTKVVQW